MISDLGRREEELAGKTMLVYGLGSIGSRLARLARAFDMKVVGIKRDTATSRRLRRRGAVPRIGSSTRSPRPTSSSSRAR